MVGKVSKSEAKVTGVSEDNGQQQHQFGGHFSEDDHFFHRDYLTPQQADDDAAELLGLLNLAPGSRVLDAGCGDGRLAVRLAAIGFSVVAIDADAAQLERARSEAQRRGVDVEWRHGDLRDLADEDTFDGAALWFNTYGFEEQQGNEELLTRIAQSLRPGAPLVIDTLWHEGVAVAVAEETEPVCVKIDDATQWDFSEVDLAEHRLVTRRIVERNGVRSERTLSIQMHTLEEWALVLGHCGLQFESATSRAGGVLGPDSLELVLVSRRKG